LLHGYEARQKGIACWLFFYVVLSKILRNAAFFSCILRTHSSWYVQRLAKKKRLYHLFLPLAPFFLLGLLHASEVENSGWVFSLFEGLFFICLLFSPSTVTLAALHFLIYTHLFAFNCCFCFPFSFLPLLFLPSLTCVICAQCSDSSTSITSNEALGAEHGEEVCMCVCCCWVAFFFSGHM
jgi:hypothetical protein